MLMEKAHSRHVREEQKAAAVSGQFAALLVKQYLKQALKPMFKGIFDETGGASGMYRHLFTDALAESIAQGGGFGVSTMLQMHLNKKVDAEAAVATEKAAEIKSKIQNTEASDTYNDESDGKLN